MELSKTQLLKIVQSGGVLGRPLGPLLKIGLPLRKHVPKPLAKSVIIPLGLTAAAATDSANQKKILGSDTKTLIILNEEKNDIMKILSSLKNLVY